MRIEFHGPSICDFSKFEKDGTIEVPDGITLKQFLKIVKLPKLLAKTKTTEYVNLFRYLMVTSCRMLIT